MKNLIILILSAASLLISSCSFFLDVKPKKTTVVPRTLKDLQALLDNTDIMNTNATPSLGETSADDFWVSVEDWQSSNQEQRRAYTWQEEIFEITNNLPADWLYPYQQITYANLALERLKVISPALHEVEIWNNIKGSALFFRAWAHFNLAQLFCKQYDANTANDDLGIPLRLTADINETILRSSVQETYNQIIDDLNQAVELLPIVPLVKTRPGKVAAEALLARVYLQMDNYSEAYQHATSALETTNELLDLNLLDSDASYPFEQFNQEVVFHNTLRSQAILNQSVLRVDSTLYASYTNEDLRKAMFFEDNGSWVRFRGSYDGSSSLFSGLAVNEICLIKIEAAARLGYLSESHNDFKKLLAKRYRNGTAPNLSDMSEEKYLKFVLGERRKELLFRGIRWSDLRRLNRDDRFSRLVSRQLGPDIFSLQPNSNLYVLPIPQIVIMINGIEQNIR